MAGSTFGNHFKITTWGESHGKGIGVVVDGCPAGLPLDKADIQKFLDRRKPGQSKFSTQRQEADAVEILSGTFEGRTTGTPISLVVFNKDQIIIYNDLNCQICNMKGVDKFTGEFEKRAALIIPTSSAYKYVAVTADSIDSIELN